MHHSVFNDKPLLWFKQTPQYEWYELLFGGFYILLTAQTRGKFNNGESFFDATVIARGGTKPVHVVIWFLFFFLLRPLLSLVLKPSKWFISLHPGATVAKWIQWPTFSETWNVKKREWNQRQMTSMELNCKTQAYKVTLVTRTLLPSG